MIEEISKIPPELKDFEVTIRVTISAHDRTEAITNVTHALESFPTVSETDLISCMVPNKPASCDMTREQDVAFYGATRVFRSLVATLKDRQRENFATVYTKMTFRKWRNYSALMNKTIAGTEMLRNSVAEVWRIHDTDHVWITKFRTYAKK
jgi:hypothetical protein